MSLLLFFLDWNILRWLRFCVQVWPSTNFVLPVPVMNMVLELWICFRFYLSHLLKMVPCVTWVIMYIFFLYIEKRPIKLHRIKLMNCAMFSKILSSYPTIRVIKHYWTHIKLKHKRICFATVWLLRCLVAWINHLSLSVLKRLLVCTFFSLHLLL